LNEFPLDAVFNITVKKDVLIEKLLGRRMCNKCGASFNVCDIQRDGYSMDPMLPQKPGICDFCGG
jgi:adenylate kinase